MIAYQKTRYDKRRELLEKMAGGSCSTCGSDASLQFDHIDPKTKLFNLSGAHLNRKWQTVLEEFHKCQLLCRSCHMKKTWNKDRERVKHATPSGYTGGCRCVPCTNAAVDYNRKLKARKKQLAVA